MKDKIYLVRPYCASEQELPFISKDELPGFSNTVYIRKDALMEWANSWLAFKRSGVVLDDGFSYAMEELIKKLNSL